mgnify:CR=1 FL=1
MKHFVCMQIFHRHEPQPILALGRVVAISQSVSRTRRLARPRGGGPGSGLGSGSGTGADRPFRIVKS